MRKVGERERDSGQHLRRGKECGGGVVCDQGDHSWVWTVVLLAEVTYSHCSVRTVPGRGNMLEIIIV